MNITEAQALANKMEKFSGGDTTTRHWLEHDRIYELIRRAGYDVCYCGAVYIVSDNETSCSDCPRKSWRIGV